MHEEEGTIKHIRKLYSTALFVTIMIVTPELYRPISLFIFYDKGQHYSGVTWILTAALQMLFSRRLTESYTKLPSI